MSLNWNFSRIDNHESVCFEADGTMRTQTYMLVMATMALDIGDITTKNADEFWRRLNLWQHSIEHFMSTKEGPVYFTKGDVYQHVGLRTNVSNVSATQWNRRFKDKLFQHAVERAREAERELEALTQ